MLLLLFPAPGNSEPEASPGCAASSTQKSLDLVGEQVDGVWIDPAWNFEVQNGAPPDIIMGLCKGSRKCNPQDFTSQRTEKNEGRCLFQSDQVGVKQLSPLIECGCWPSKAGVHGHVNWVLPHLMGCSSGKAGQSGMVTMISYWYPDDIMG